MIKHCVVLSAISHYHCKPLIFQGQDMTHQDIMSKSTVTRYDLIQNLIYNMQSLTSHTHKHFLINLQKVTLFTARALSADPMKDCSVSGREGGQPFGPWLGLQSLVVVPIWESTQERNRLTELLCPCSRPGRLTSWAGRAVNKTHAGLRCPREPSQHKVKHSYTLCLHLPP